MFTTSTNMANTSTNNIVLKNSYSADDAAKGMFYFLVIQVLMTFFFYMFSYVTVNATVANILLNIIVDSTFIFTVWIVAKQSRVDFGKATGFKGEFKPIYILIALGISVVSLFAFSSATNLFMEILYRLGYNSVTSNITMNNFGDYAINVVLICILPALCEEILFRGLIYNGLSKISRKVGIWGSAILFMLIHGSPDQTVHQLILGVILALSLEATQTIWVPILIHFFNNFIAVSVNYFFYSDAATEAAVNSSVSTSLGVYIVYAVLFTAIGIYLVSLLIKWLKQTSQISEENSVQVRDLSTGGTIESEILPLGDPQQEYFGDNFVNYQPKRPSEQFSSQGRLFITLATAWMALDWLLALIAGFAYSTIL